ncbi:MAG: hypothetical protein H7A51_02610 [Akkermansiaceae bacterium]|nr:hypothetical protein [Akkermansiaceae bacterium]
MDQETIAKAAAIKQAASEGTLSEKEAVRQLIALGSDPVVAAYYIEAAIHGEDDCPEP